MSPRQELEALIAEYRREVPEKIARLEALLERQSFPELCRELHTLAGSAGTFGLPKLGTSLDSAQRAELERLLGVLRHDACIT